MGDETRTEEELNNLMWTIRQYVGFGAAVDDIEKLIRAHDHRTRKEQEQRIATLQAQADKATTLQQDFEAMLVANNELSLQLKGKQAELEMCRQNKATLQAQAEKLAAAGHGLETVLLRATGVIWSHGSNELQHEWNKVRKEWTDVLREFRGEGG